MKHTRLKLAGIIAALLLAVATIGAQDGPIQALSNIGLKTDSNGYLYVAATTSGVAPDSPITAGSNIGVRTDSNGYLKVVCASGCSTGTSDTFASTTSPTSGLFWNASGWWDLKVANSVVGNITGNGIYGGGNFATQLTGNGVVLSSNADAGVFRNAAGVTEINSGTLNAYRDLKLRMLRVGQTTAPTCTSNCGTSPSVTGSDTAMVVTMGASGVPASGWVVTFNGTWAAAPSCIAQSQLGTMVVGKMPIALAVTTTTVTVTTNGTAPSTSDKYAIHCIGVS